MGKMIYNHSSSDWIIRSLLFLVLFVSPWLSPSVAFGQANIALSATANHSGGGLSAYAPSNYNDNIVAANTGCTSSAEPWGWVLTNGWITLTWPSPVSFNKIVLYKSNRPMTSCTMEYWDGSTFVPFLSYTSSTCAQDSVIFSPVTTTILRFNNCSGSSNPNHREIKVFSNVTPPPTITGSTVYCVGQTISLSASSTVVGPVYTWSGPSGFLATGASISIPGASVANAGVYSCVVTPTGGGASSAPSLSTVTVNPLPSAISGTTAVCAPGTTTVTCTPVGGTWSSSSVAIFAVSGAGTTATITGVASGVATVSYTMGGGCNSVAYVTVNAAPTATVVATPASFCSGSSASLSASTPATTNVLAQNFNSGLGLWSVSNTGGIPASFWQISASPAWGGVAGDGSNMAQAASDAYSSVTATALISPVFSLVGFSSGTLSCNQFYSASAGDASVNIEYSINGGASWNTLSSLIGTTVGGFTWSSSSPTSTYLLPGAMMGQANCRLRWTYVSTAGLWWALDNINVSGAAPAPASVSWAPAGSLYTDAGLSTPYTGGIISGPVYAAPAAVSAPVVQTYSAVVTSGGCTNSSGVGTVTVNPIPEPISGPSVVCAGSSIVLSSSTSGGSWISGSANATVSGAGTTCTVTGVSAGTATISYVVGSGCLRTVIVTVHPLPAIITGPTSVCAGANITLLNATPLGNWSSFNPGIATVGATSGVVSGIVAGTTQVSYTTTEGCSRSVVVTVNALPGAISGSSQVCTGASVGLSSSPTGGAWLASNSNVSLSFAGASSTVDGVSAGTTIISYVLGSGCYSLKVVTVNETPAAITGPSSVCVGSTTSLSNSTAGGSWFSQNILLATVDAIGNVSGVSGGSLVISYVTGAGCFSVRGITVNTLPSVLSGSASVCTGSATIISSSPVGGVWSADNANVTLSFSGATCTVNGAVAGTSTLSYMLGTGCYRTGVVTVNETPAAITGPSSLCEGALAAYGTVTGGGTWSVSNAAIGAITSGGIFSALSAGSLTLSYTTAAGCFATREISVNMLPAVISGIPSVCTGSATLLSSGTPGGLWTAGNTLVSLAAAGTSCTVSGVSSGTSVVTYSLPTGCRRTVVVTVNESPAPITGPTSVCVGNTIALVETTTGGTWISSNPAVALVDAAGTVSGLNSGSSTISYVTAAACSASVVITVNSSPAAITGELSICTGSGTVLSSSGVGGVWSASSPSVALSPAGITCSVTGISAGTVQVSYTSASGCSRAAVVTVNETPGAITGAMTVCVASSTLLANATAGGVWISGNLSVASVSAGGLVTGVAAGFATISYVSGAGCYAVAVVTVNGLPALVTGTSTVCEGAYTVLSSATAGGAWLATGVTASVAAAGSICTVNGLVAGTAEVSYVLPTGCFRSAVVTVNVTPASISGASSVCVGTSILLNNITTGGSWISGNPAIGTISSTGSLTGINAGMVPVSYMMPTGCHNTATITVNAVPAGIASASSVCEGSSVTATVGTPGGTWSVSATNVALSPSGTSCVINGISAGSVHISYTLSTGCYSTLPFTVLVQPTSITGTPILAPAGGTTTLNSMPAGGVWSSSNLAVATVGSSTGIVTGGATGTSDITYTATSGCFVAVQVTVVPLGINGPSTVCAGATATYTHALAGGTWSGSVAGVASIDAISGVLTAIAGGPVTITYTPFAGFFQTRSILVQGTLPVIGGATSVCMGASAGLTATPASGVWTSSDTGIVSVNSTTAVATGNSVGVAVLTYTLGTCFTSRVFSVNPLPEPILGVENVCVGATVGLSSTPAGGSWSASGTAAIVAVDGVVTGVAPGTTIVSYTNTFGCRRTLPMTVNALPSVISGTTSLCQGSVSSLSSSPSGLSWESANPLVATVASVTGTVGQVSGVAIGTTIISCTSAVGCIRTTTVTVTAPLPAIAGASFVCPGGTVVLSSAATGGAWSSGTPAKATIAGGTGIVTGVAAGTSVITYTTAPACFATAVMTVYPTPDAISGTTTLCAGSQTVLSHTTSGGTWTSSNSLAATVGSADGVVTGLNAGTTNITYRISEGCFRTAIVSVSATPPSISGPSFVCEGSSILLTNAVGGTWSSSDTMVATVPAGSGVVAGLLAGTVTISFRAGATGCVATKMLSVNTAPSAITGPDVVCASQTATFSATPAGGTWSSGAVAVLGVAASPGTFIGNSAGAASITYLLNGCRNSKIVSVVTLPGVISGVLTLCSGANTTLSSFTPGLTWSSESTSVATVASASSTTCLVTGVDGGTSTISYTNAAGCARTVVVTVTPSPSDIGGASQICVGGTTTLSNAISGGSWSSSTPTVASITLSGNITGVSTGTTVITYRTSGTCFVTAIITVNAAPSDPIGGSLGVCAGATTDLTYAVAGGTWSSSNTTRATVDAGGTVTGVSAGTSVITYTTGESCYRTAVVTVNPLPAAIAGTASVCESGTTTFSNAVPGGTWLSSDEGIALVGSTTGVISGIDEGVASIVYRLVSTGCSVTRLVTVNALPTAILGTNPLCVGDTTTWESLPAGGVWSTSTPAVSINATGGLVTAVSSGTSVISYSLPTGCRRTAVATVNSLPSPISGTLIMCIGSTTTLNSATAGQTWSSANTMVATVGSATSITGVVSGLASGTTEISYTNGAGCSRYVVVTVTSSPTDIEGDDLVCVGGATTLTNPLPGGTWSGGGSNATVNVSTGLVTGIAIGSTRITYRIGAACYTTKVMTVSVQPSTPIVGPGTVCAGASISLSHPTSGGFWSSSNTARAIVGSSTGIVTGVSSGSLAISYFISAGCYKTTSITVPISPMPISGPLTVCEGSNVTLSSATAGASWSSTDLSVATVSASTGVVTGVSAGTSTIVYTSPLSGCFVTRPITVNPLPTAIDGSSTVCVGGTTTLTGTPAGGTWVTSAGIYATVVPATGVVTGVAASSVRITYTLPTTCRIWRTMTVNPIPGNITGAASVTVPGSTTLSCVSVGGTWASSDVTRATIGATTGVMSGVSAGTVTITYQLSSTGCFRTRVATVNPASPRPQLDNDIASGVRIYPSPTNGLLSVDYQHDGVLELFAADGRVVEHYTIRQPQTIIQLPGYLAAGVYMCRFTGEDGQIAIVRIVYTP